jgi:Flp pilus assembly protein TadD
MENAIAQQRRVVAADPLSATNRTNLGIFLTMVGRLPEARMELERALELSPASVVTTASIANVLILQGRADQALKVLSRLPDDYIRDEGFALAHFARGDVAESDAMLARLLARAGNTELDVGEFVTVAVAVAEVYATRNDADRAFAWLKKARLRAAGHEKRMRGWLMHENLQVTPFLKPLHADPRWDELLASVSK